MPIRAIRRLPVSPASPGNAPLIRPDVRPRPRVRRPVAPIAPPAAAPSLQPQPKPEKKARDYEVGHGKPPKEGQFKKGQSGNPRGRPKGSKSLKTIMRQLLTEKVTVKTAAGPKRMTKIEAVAHKLLERAFSGDLRALKTVVDMHRMAFPDEPVLPTATAAPVAAADMDETDAAMLDELKAILLAESGSS